MTSLKGFQHHFNIISKFVCCGCYMKKNAAFALISFAVLKWHECLSFQLPFELTVEIPVQLHLEPEVNLLVHNVIEREIEREKVQMKPPNVMSTFVFDNFFREIGKLYWLLKIMKLIWPFSFSMDWSRHQSTYYYSILKQDSKAA